MIAKLSWNITNTDSGMVLASECTDSLASPLWKYSVCSQRADVSPRNSDPGMKARL